jgi:hypothetical protein
MRAFLCLIILVWSVTASAQFKVVGPAPFTEPVARQKIRAQLDNVTAANRQETLDTLNGWLAWYRDLLDEELIAAWKRDTRANLVEVMAPLANPRVASAVIEFSWGQQRQQAFLPAYAPMFENLMTRFADSARPFLDDLLGATPVLSQTEAEAACRILIDMPDIGTWRKDALRILPHYRRVAESLLAKDLRGGDSEKSDRAELLLRELRSDRPDVATRTPAPRRSAPVAQSSTGDRPIDRPTLATAGPPPGPKPAPRVAPAYEGPKSGTLECSGGPIPQNAEYVFRNLPAGKLQLDYDTKVWEARLTTSEGQTQRLILKNKGTGPQKRCVVHWSVIP